MVGTMMLSAAAAPPDTSLPEGAGDTEPPAAMTADEAVVGVGATEPEAVGPVGVEAGDGAGSPVHAAQVITATMVRAAAANCRDVRRGDQLVELLRTLCPFRPVNEVSDAN